MNKFLKIEILVPTRDKAGEFKRIYFNRLQFDENVCVPYTKIVDGLNILYPQNDKIINFSLY